MSLHERLTEEIRKGPSGPEVAALFDLDQTLLAGFSAGAFLRERSLSGRMAPRELLERAAPRSGGGGSRRLRGPRPRAELLLLDHEIRAIRRRHLEVLAQLEEDEA